jgi:phage tail-like protein
VIAAASAFLLEIDGISSGSFVSCSGLAESVEVLEVREGGTGAVHKLRGGTVSSNIVLERGLVTDRELHDWFARGDRREGAIVLLAASGKEAARWTFHRGWPCRWEGPALHAWDRAVALERLEIAHEGVAWVER